MRAPFFALTYPEKGQHSASEADKEGFYFWQPSQDESVANETVECPGCRLLYYPLNSKLATLGQEKSNISFSSRFSEIRGEEDPSDI